MEREKGRIVSYMSACGDANIVCAWTNGRKADVYLVEQEGGCKVVVKRYRLRFIATFVRECLTTRYLSQRIDVLPRVVACHPLQRELVLSYMEGERVLEWVLARYGERNIKLDDFRSCHGLERNDVIARAFTRFRASEDGEASVLKRAIRDSYKLLHGTGFTHGSADPRNVIYDGRRAFIIDYDHSRPSRNPVKSDGRSLQRWYGITL